MACSGVEHDQNDGPGSRVLTSDPKPTAVPGIRGGIEQLRLPLNNQRGPVADRHNEDNLMNMVKESLTTSPSLAETWSRTATDLLHSSILRCGRFFWLSSLLLFVVGEHR